MLLSFNSCRLLHFLELAGKLFMFPNFKQTCILFDDFQALFLMNKVTKEMAKSLLLIGKLSPNSIDCDCFTKTIFVNRHDIKPLRNTCVMSMYCI